MGRGGKNEITDISSPKKFPPQGVWALAQRQGGKLRVELLLLLVEKRHLKSL